MRKDLDEPLYTISVAAKLVECHPQTLRQYEEMGLLGPERTPTNLRMYSDRDIERARRIRRFTQEMGVNLAGVEVILDLLERMDTVRQEMEQEFVDRIREMEEEMERLRARMRKAGGE